jgi:hypothetical protein
MKLTTAKTLMMIMKTIDQTKQLLKAKNYYMSNYKVTDWLNLRSSPEIPEDRGKNVLGILSPETVVERLADENEGNWMHVKAYLGNHLTEGFTSSLYLDETDAILSAPEEGHAGISAVHLLIKSNKLIRRNEINGRAYHLNEPGMVQVDIKPVTDIAERTRRIHDVINWLNVEHSARYAPTTLNTYCNIYAYDVAYCLGLYLPRVWWNENAFKTMQQGNTPEIIYEKTVTELNANALTNWFENYGDLFGWKRIMDIDVLQTKVNAGTLGIIVAQRINLNRSGHIVAIVPEKDLLKAQRDIDNKVISPLQSQAGSNNKKYFTGNNWWLNPNKFRKFGLWVWEV